MSGFNRFLDMMKLNDDEYDDDLDYEDYGEEEDYEEPVRVRKERSKTASSAKKATRQEDRSSKDKSANKKKESIFSRKSSPKKSQNKEIDMDYDDDFDDIDDYEDEPTFKSKAKTNSKKTRPFGRKNTESDRKIYAMPSRRAMDIHVMRPDDFDSVQLISDLILAGSATVINFDGVTDSEAQRIVDFISGACYAVNGTMKQISSTIVIAAPEEVDISGDFQELMSSAVNIPNLGYDEED